jgi:hypothetical protein
LVAYVVYGMYHKNDTFLIQRFDRDIEGYFDEHHIINGDNDSKQTLKAGLKVCFVADKYFKTKDSLYYYTGRAYTGTYYYEIYVPEYQESISVRSNQNDATFSELSKWLLSQIRLHRKEGITVENEKHEICENPFDDDH